MKKKYYWSLWYHLIFSVVIVFITFLSELIAWRLIGFNLVSGVLDIINRSSSSDAASIGIIGGSDGPTSIFVGSGFGPWILFHPQLVLFVILLLLYFPMKLVVARVINKAHNDSKN